MTKNIVLVLLFHEIKSTIFLIYDDPSKLLFYNFFAPFWVATVLCVKAGFPKSNQMGQKRKDEFFRYFRISFEKVDALKALEKWWPTDRRTEKGYPSMTFTKNPDWVAICLSSFKVRLKPYLSTQLNLCLTFHMRLFNETTVSSKENNWEIL